MNLKIVVRRVGDVVVLDLEGRLVLGKGSGDLRDTVRNLLVEGRKKILLNLQEVNYVDSSGLAEMVASLTSTGGRGGVLKLLNIQKKLAEVLRVAHLTEIFESYKDEGEALRSFQR